MVVPFESTKAAATGKFTRLTASESGIDFQNVLKPEHIKNYLLLGAGLTVGDYDNDGLPDIFLCGQDNPNKLFRQVAPWKFEDVTKTVGIGHHPGWSSGAAFVDIDNDRDLDLFVCNKGNHNELYRNQGNGTFKGGYVQQPNLQLAAPTMAAFSDYDRDGDLDLYLTKTRLLSLQEMFGFKLGLEQDAQGKWIPHPQYGDDEFEVIDAIPRELGGRDQLFEHIGLTESGIPRFVDVTAKAGIKEAPEHGLAAVWWDANNDNWPDLYISNDFHTPDHLYLNDTKGGFREVTGDAVPYTSWSSMGSDFADINNDGFIDYLSTDMAATTHFKQKTMMGSMTSTAWLLENLEPRQYMRNVLLVNTGTPQFLESAQFSGIDSTDWTWSAMFGDLDNDGWEDVFFTNGIERNVNDSDLALRMEAMKQKGATFEDIQREMAATPRHTERNLAYQNRGDLTFEDVSARWGLDLESVSHGAVFADLDRDGDLDLIVNNMNDPVAVYRNDISAAPKSLLVHLRGKQSNRFGLGARVVASTKQGIQTRIMTSSRGYMTGVEPVLHFGLGKADTVDSLEVHWPSGILQTLTNVMTGHVLTLHEPEKGAADKHRATPVTKPLFTHVQDRAGITFLHEENEYDDFAEQPLLPNRLSRFGPAMAVGDVNGDGRDDLYFGGAAAQAGTLYLQGTNGSFSPSETFTADASHEDTAAAFTDIDGDGDLDLYVVSGGASAPAKDVHYQDRLYRNEGSGKWTRSPWTSIRTSGSCVAVADFDKDGDQDLFVGSRFLPKQYPHASPSTLVVNGSPLETKALDLGLVTGAAWADVDGDSWLDLIVTREWRAPAILRNERGVLKEADETSGLSKHTGWWNGLAAADIDADGDIDFVATNFGTNTKYNASAKKPVRLYAGDFAGDGGLRLIEAVTKENQLLPVRGKSCSTHAMPHLANKFPTYKAFASASLTELYGPTKIDQSLQLSATTLESMVFINDGRGHFQGHPLPTLAQLAPGFGVVLADLDNDSHLDCVIAQNFYHPQRETGRMNASLGAFLKGDGKGQFTEVWPKESGLRFRDDTRNVKLVSANDKKLLVYGLNDGRPRVYQNNQGR